MTRGRVPLPRPGAPVFLALLSGALLALSFPKFGHPALAWVALAPLLVGVWQARARPPAYAFLLRALGEKGRHRNVRDQALARSGVVV